MKEEWKNIPGYGGMYQVSNMGRVKSLAGHYQHKREKLLSLINDGQGYRHVILYNRMGGKRKIKVHRLVAENFIAKTHDDILLSRDSIDHIDGVRDNNVVENLRWCTKLENSRFDIARMHHRQAAHKKTVYCIDLGVVFESVRDCARKLGVTSGTISAACLGKKKMRKHQLVFYEATAEKSSAVEPDKK